MEKQIKEKSTSKSVSLDDPKFEINKISMQVNGNFMQSLYNLANQISSQSDSDSAIKASFRVRFKEIENYKDGFQQAFNYLMAKCIDVNLSGELDKQFNKFYDMYYSIQILSENILSTNNTQRSKELPSQHITKTKQFNLPKITLPHFSGIYTEWPHFIAMFTSLVHNNMDISSVQKMHYLFSVLDKEPLNLIKHLELSECNYQIAFNILTDRYENKRIIADKYLESVLTLNSLNTNQLHSNLRKLVNILKENIQALSALRFDTESWSFILVHIILRKLPVDLRSKFELEHCKSSYNINDIPTFTDLLNFLETQLRVMDSVIGGKNIFLNSGGTHSNSSKSFIVKAPVTCACCKGDHNIYNCETFNSMTPSCRKDFVIKNKLCYNCLRSHLVNKCQSKGYCQVCHKRHHTKLHIDYTPGSHDQPANCEQGITTHSSSVNFSNCSSECTMLLGTAIVGVLDCNGQVHAVRALLDSDSQVSIITENLAQKLRLPRSKSNFLYGLGESNAQRTYGSIECSIFSLSKRSKPPLPTLAIILKRITGTLPSVPVAPEVVERCRDISLADSKFFIPGPIDMLIGVDLYNQVFDGRRMQIGDGLPTVHASIFGWILMGPAPVNTMHLLHHQGISNEASHCTLGLDRIISRFWEIEEAPTMVIQDPEHLQCEKHFLETHQRDVTGRFVVRLPFKTAHKPLGSTYENALKRFNNLERRLYQNPVLKDLYTNFMSDYLTMGHMRLVSSPISSDRYYIPHYGVLKESSSTTKLRAVFDASAPSSNGISLNQVLLSGPKLQQNIEDVILRFRTHAIVFTCDIKQMYRQVRLHDDDCKYQTVFWRDSPSRLIQQYELTTVTYGVSSAAYLAMRVINELSALNETTFPEAARVLREDTFVDDIISGGANVSSVKLLQQQVIDVLAQGGFDVRKWVSNNDELLRGYPSDHLEKPFRFEESGDNIFKIFGIGLNSHSDSFVFEVSTFLRCTTKRQILSNIARIYDPCGFLTPVTFYAKAMMQKLWALEVSWDEPLPEELSRSWDSFVEGLKLLKLKKISRFVLSSNSFICQLMGFCDASESGYAAVVYLRVQDSSGIAIHLLLSKSRVAPLKQRLTIPRLELCGAVLLARLMSHVNDVLSKRVIFEKGIAWCNSSIVLAWLRTPPHKLHIFEGNRVSQVQGLIPTFNWRYVPSAFNPADCASRGVVAPEIVDHGLWWSPSWLKDDPSTWPVDLLIGNEDLPDLADVTLVSVSAPSLQEDDNVICKLILGVSSLSKLQGILGRLLRFCHNLRNFKAKIFDALSVFERNSALHTAIRVVQRIVFKDKIKLIKGEFNVRGSMAQLDPFICSDGLLRVGGRLKHSNLPYSVMHPILLPKNHHFTNIIIDYYHLKYLHVGPSSLIHILRQKFWIISARGTVRRRKFQCTKCYRLKAKVLEPFMGNLPPSRVCEARLFQKVGIDFAGPFLVKSSTTRSSQRSKAYLCVYICLAVKAVHLEVTSDLTTEAFVASLQRFVSRRGLVSDIYTDCGKNFQGAKRHLREVETFLQLNNKHFESNFSKLGINWHMNPPYAPHMGGLWESTVKSAKQLLKRQIGEQVLTYEELATVFARVEAVLNSRPICPMSDDVSDFNVPSPGHFLIGQPLVALPEYDFDHTPISPLKRWKLVQQLSQHFWQRWHREYLHTLQQRSKWCKNIPNIKVGDLVLIKEDNLPPLKWKLGRVSVLHPGTDGVVRVVELKFSSGSCLRSLSKLCSLPQQDDN